MRWVWLSLLLLGVAIVTAFTIQNSTFEAPLQLDLWLVAYRLKRPISVSALMWICFGAGASLTALLYMGRTARLASRVRQLEQEIALGGRQKDPWAGA